MAQRGRTHSLSAQMGAPTQQDGGIEYEWAWACRSHQAERWEMWWLTRSLLFPQGRSLSFKTFLVWVLISIYQGKRLSLQ